MYIESMELLNYRNYDQTSVSFSSGVNILYGDNAQGKTNLLEAIYLCGTTKSHRRCKDKEMIRFGSDQSHIKLMFCKNDLSHRVDMHFRSNYAKGIAIDGNPIRKSSQLLGMMHIVFFSPEDLKIIKNGPSERRRFIDLEMSQIDEGYLQYSVLYSKALIERNNLLKQIDKFPQLRETLDVWDEQLINYGSIIIKKRIAFIEKLNGILKEIHKELTGGKEEIKVSYEKNVSVQEYCNELKRKRDSDIKSGTTSVGPHRDDIMFSIDGVDIRKFGSQGQQRTAALSLKLSEIKIIREMTGDDPVLLLDDVLSELDSKRQQYLLDCISEIQTIISCTGLDELVHSRLKLDKVFYVKNGTINEYEKPEIL